MALEKTSTLGTVPVPTALTGLLTHHFQQLILGTL